MTDKLKRQNGTWNKAWLTKDVTAVERIAATDYMYIGPQGQVLRRADILKIVRSRSYRLARGKWTELSISALGSDAALVVDRFSGEGEYRRWRFVEDHRRTAVWVRRAGRWQVRLEHCSAITGGGRKGASQGRGQKQLPNNAVEPTVNARHCLVAAGGASPAAHRER